MPFISAACLITYDFLRVLFFLEIWIVIEVDVGNMKKIGE